MTAVKTAPEQKKQIDEQAQIRAKHARLMKEYGSDIEKANHIVNYGEHAEKEAIRAMKQASKYSKRRYG